MFRNLVLLCMLLLMVGCSYEPIKPWHRDILSQEHMLTGGNPMISAIDGKIYFSREASHGVTGFGGGGCGCN